MSAGILKGDPPHLETRHMATTGHSAKLYQERREPDIRTTLRGPGMQIYLPDNAVHALKLEAPLPLPEVLNNNCSPKDGLTSVWPHGDENAP
jgi:hypothetical protein